MYSEKGSLQQTPSELQSIDLAGFNTAIDSLRNRAYQGLGAADISHLQKIERRGYFFALIGYSSAWILPNPISAFCISFAQFTRWLLAHHILHRGYDKVPGIPKRYTSRYFAQSWRRFIDWFDWLHPAAWSYEHNQLHHYHTGEHDDPDLVERHSEFLRQLKVPVFLKHLFLFLAGLTWKYTYYAPNTMSVLNPNNLKRLKKEHIIYITIKNIFDFRNAHVRRLWYSGYLPYGVVHFALIPLLFSPLGTSAVYSVLINKILAECITNIHSFIVIAPNHSADDLYRFDFHYENKEEFYLTQVLGSANYHTGTDVIDHLQIWLNYQIEHHLFPDLPMLRYQKIQPEVKAICEEFGVPYRQEHVFKRFWKMIAICTGKRSMRRVQTFAELGLR